MPLMYLEYLSTSDILLLISVLAASILLFLLYKRFPLHLIYRSKIGLESMLDAIADPLAVISADYTIRRVNRAYTALIGRSFQASIGKKCYSLLRNRATICDDCLLSETLSGNTTKLIEHSAHPCGKGAVSIVFSPYTIPTDNATEVCIIEHIRDITTLEQLKYDLERKNRSLAKTTKKLKKAQQSIKSELKMARQIQQGLLPSSTPQVNGINLDVIYQPVSDVGGDIYDFFPISKNKFGIFIGDASGHGYSSALIGTLSKMSLYHHSQSSISTAELLTRMNLDLLANIHTSHYLTGFWCIFDLENKQLAYSRAGHPIPVVMRRDGSLLTLTGNGPFLGIIENAAFEQKKFDFQEGDRFFFFTDGIHDVVSKELVEKSVLGYDQFMKMISATSEVSFSDIISFIRSRLADYKYEDDYTLIVAEISKYKVSDLSVYQHQELTAQS